MRAFLHACIRRVARFESLSLTAYSPAHRYRCFFGGFPFFNRVQSAVLDEVLHSDRPLVVSAPTGSGKTAILELALVRLLTQRPAADFKALYVVPLKAICRERLEDWSRKTASLGLHCAQLTGDTDEEDRSVLQEAHLILTTPEKWDSATRRWKDSPGLLESLALLLIDEVQLVHEAGRGPVLEAVVSRMKALQRHNGTPLRIVAVSAPVPNAADLASWLGTEDNPGCHHTFGERLRPVPLRRLVLGYPCAVGTSDFRFDMSLSYKLPLVIENYSEGKPTIVFCSTRKGVLQTAGVVAGNCSNLVRDVRTRDRLLCAATTFRDAKLRDVVPRGVGFHHAGLCPEDRGAVESLFREGGLPVLVSTSTLAMGVNLPAHLVVVKSTSTYALGGTGLYPDLVVDQMLGRAGRPQFDVSGTAVIMTKLSLKPRYEQLVQGTQAMESSLHRSLVEHLNAEIVLRTVRDLAGCVTWAKSTFFYVRLRKNPAHYGQPRGLGEQGAQDKLHELCRESVTALVRASLITLDADSGCLEPTGAGHLMARYCISLDTMERFSQLPARLSLETLVATLSGCAEYADVQLRTSEKATLNKLNGTKRAPGIRFPMKGRIKTRDMKVNCLLQASLGCLSVTEPSLSQDLPRVLRVAQRLAKVLLEFLLLRPECGFGALLQAVVLHKCIQARLWEDSLHVARQIDKIGVALSSALLRAGITSLDKLVNTNPRELELVLNRHPPFGSQVLQAARSLPKYRLQIVQEGSPSNDTATVQLSVEVGCLGESVAEPGSGRLSLAPAYLLVGDADDRLLLHQCISSVPSRTHST
ncbi:hypothetical protein HPB47_023013 [Ixodes persulcatus]|uniref:Uncharacterized protein n=1 Tax=Ixodes persulcatus TaxID=34615 RepID=A0AC60Q866_IXOPE|nr:hypothetical protein HPB47_023013 [Ixodes persulcatus]